MSEQQGGAHGSDGPRVVVVGPDGEPLDPAELAQVQAHANEQAGEESRNLTDLVEQPAKVMRIGGMIRQLLEEVKAAPLDEAGRKRLAGVLHQSIDELKDGLAPELDDELSRLVRPFDTDTVPSESELRIAQAQLVGWLEGLFHGIQTAIYAQQMAARAQLEQMRRGLPAGSMGMGGPGGPGGPVQQDEDQAPGQSGGMYL